MNETIYLRNAAGATHQLTGRRLKKLIRELRAGRGGVEIADLAEAGYTGFLGPDGEDWCLESLSTIFPRV